MKKFMLRRDASANTVSQSSSSKKKDKDDFVPPPPSALETMLARAGPVKDDGSDKFFGFENAVLNYPRQSPPETLRESLQRCMKYPTPESIREDLAPPPKESKQNTATSKIAGAATPQQQKPEDKNSSEYKKRVAMATLPILNAQDNSRSYGMQESMFTALKDLFESIVASKERMGVIKPQRFLEVLRRDYEMFRTAMHQDAHEFLNILLNEVVNNVESNAARSASSDSDVASDKGSGSESEHSQESSIQHSHHSGGKSSNMIRWVHELFEGILTSETQCLTCETKSQRDEVFLDLSVDLEQHASVTSCLRKFSAEEMLCERDKFHCDNCGGLQEAEKRMVIKRLPRILALHLKRFKYTEDLQRLQKLFHCVVYPYYLRLFNTTDDAEDPDRLYELYAVVVHIGGGPHHGHYVSIIKTEEYGWCLFDDELVEPVDKNYVRNFFGDKPGLACAYVLFYQETTMEKMQRDQETEAMREHEVQMAEVKAAATAVNGASGDGPMSTLHKVTSWQRRDSAATPVSPFSVFDRQKTNGSPGHSPATPNGNNSELPNIAALSPETNRERMSSSPNPSVEPTNPSTQTAGLDGYYAASTTKEVRKGEAISRKERAKEEKERKAADKAEKERKEKEREKVEKQKRKELKEALKRQDMELRAALEASRQSKLEEDKKAKERQKEDANYGGLSRFRITSKSFGLSVKTHHPHKEKEREKDRVPATAHPSGKSETPSFEKGRRVSMFTQPPTNMRYDDEDDDHQSNVEPFDVSSPQTHHQAVMDFVTPTSSNVTTNSNGIGTPVSHAATCNAAPGPSQLNGIDSALHAKKNHVRRTSAFQQGKTSRSNSQPEDDMHPQPTANSNNYNSHGAPLSLRSTTSFLHSAPRKDSHSGNSSGHTVDEYGIMASPKGLLTSKRSRFSFRKKSPLY
ncbi:hypothetical protein KEM54_004095 [Ascosphaera aggregata]|nr:hypothetical protein KEM54_004095 [Ascosphaera aggregata]